MNDSRKTKQELIEELKALREKVDGGKSGNPGPGGDYKRSVGLTRREVLSGWVAPIILTVPLTSRTVLAKTGGGFQVDAVPTTVNVQIGGTTPSSSPTQSPTNFPTQTPTNFPTQIPTNFPTQTPTNYPTQIPTTNRPTQTPTNYPTQRPTNYPTQTPTNYPTQTPTNYVTQTPTSAPPTAFPTVSPTSVIPVELIEFEIE